MPANAALYLPNESVDLTRVFDTAKAYKPLFGEVTHFEVMLGNDAARFSVMPRTEVALHIAGLLRYIDSLDQDATRKSAARRALSHTKTVLGLVTEREFEENHAIWQALFRIADVYDGFVFVYESVLLPSGAVLVGPMLDDC
jgi:hypothetical protein